MNSKNTPRDQERPFHIDELFFSTTDRKGIIQSGNSVFARVAGYGRVENLIGKPHNIIRHPDMPRAVFKLLWDEINQNKPFVGYVKNMAADGCYYWVVALVVPIENGFLSVRFKPSSDYFPIVKNLYAEMLEVERRAGNNWRAGVIDASELLGAKLSQYGFEDYEAFMQTAIAAEIASRSNKLKESGDAKSFIEASCDLKDTLRICKDIERQLEELFSSVIWFLNFIEKLNTRSATLNRLSSEIKMVSLNGIVASHQLGEAGTSLAVVTQHLATISGESTEAIKNMNDQLLSLTRLMHKTAFAITSAKLQVNMATFFTREIVEAKESNRFDEEALERNYADIQTLIESFSASTAKMLETLPIAQNSVALLTRLRNDLHHSLFKLSSVRVTGKVQAAVIEGAAHFQNLFANVSRQLDTAEGELRELSDAIPYLKGQLPKIAATGNSIQHKYNSFQELASLEYDAIV